MPSNPLFNIGPFGAWSHDVAANSPIFFPCTQPMYTSKVAAVRVAMGIDQYTTTAIRGKLAYQLTNDLINYEPAELITGVPELVAGDPPVIDTLFRLLNEDATPLGMLWVRFGIIVYNNSGTTHNLANISMRLEFLAPLALVAPPP